MWQAVIGVRQDERFGVLAGTPAATEIDNGEVMSLLPQSEYFA